MNGLRTSKGFQSTHPRGVRLFPFIPKEAGRDVSIHAPAWGATGPSLQQSAILQSFNPRTRVGCDPTTPAVWWPSSSFNPRTRVGCDLMPRGGVILLILFQSTHPRGVRRLAAHRPLDAPARFNPRTRVGCDPKPGCGKTTVMCFNPRTRVGCDLDAQLPRVDQIQFQSTHPRGVRRCSWEGRGAHKGFNPRTRVGCDLATWLHRLHLASFNPRTRVGCDLLRQLLDVGDVVSIHAPAWGATLAPGRGGLVVNVSIHAPAWGATAAAVVWAWRPIGFNPRTRVGCDLPDQALAVGHGPVSIHAPAWGATSTVGRCGVSPSCFNPRTRVGCDFHLSSQAVTACSFQSTHPRGVRLMGKETIMLCPSGFNPRTRVGCDAYKFVAWFCNNVFQSTHPRGVRPDA